MKVLTLGMVFLMAVPSLEAVCTRFDNSSSIQPVSRRTALEVGVVAVIWIP